MSQAPYSPLRKPEKHVSTDDMNRILDKHRNKADTAPSDAGAVVPVVSGSLPNIFTADGAGSLLPVSSPPSKIPDLKHEMWLATRLKAHGAAIFTGDTDPALRRDRFRKAIRDNLLGLVVVGQKDGKPMDYAAAFESLYGEKL